VQDLQQSHVGVPSVGQVWSAPQLRELSLTETRTGPAPGAAETLATDASLS
jgi:hypothetical protein